MKKLLILLIVSLVVFIIYLTTLDKKVYYLALGDNQEYPIDIKNSFQNKLEVFVPHYTKRIVDLIWDIENNKEIMVNGKIKTMKNALIKADVITMTFSNELDFKLSINEYNFYTYIDEVLMDMDHLFQLIREYCKEDVFLIDDSLNYPKDIADYLNRRLYQLCNHYHISFIHKNEIEKEVLDKLLEE